MGVTVEPASSLDFHIPLSATDKVLIKISNDEPGPLVFKVKTTNPQSYVVRPNSGVVPSKGFQEIQVFIQNPSDRDPASLENSKDKFLVQYMSVPKEFEDRPEKELPSLLFNDKNKEGLNEKRLKCVFIPPKEDASATTPISESVSIPPTASANPSFSSLPPPSPISAAPSIPPPSNLSLSSSSAASISSTISATSATTSLTTQPVDTPAPAGVPAPAPAPVQAAPAQAVSAPAAKPAAEKTRPISLSEPADASLKSLNKRLEEAQEKSRQLASENASLKKLAQSRRADSAQPSPSLSSSSSSTLKLAKPKPAVDPKLLLIVSLVSLFLGFQLAKFF